MDRYVAGLKPHIRKELELREPKTYEEAVRLAERLDAIGKMHTSGYASYQPAMRNTHHIPYASASTSRQSAARDGPVPMDLGMIQRVPERKPQSFKPLTFEERQRLRRMNACFLCRQTGHTKNNCPMRYNQENMHRPGRRPQ
mmetsp:Transcript_27406/g.59946  ORF Transcript_27406/g.59946 Transcript_27406/m.59946 type:complete len:142 (+) Transcript_27406:2-427(+)